MIFCVVASDDPFMLIGRALAFALRGHQKLVLENLALRQQLTAAKRTAKRPSTLARTRLARDALIFASTPATIHAR